MLQLLTVFSLNEIGRRPNLEDSLYPAVGLAGGVGRLFLVCDGVGGANKGEVASQIVCEVLGKMLVSQQNINKQHVQAALNSAIGQMASYISQHPDSEGMATTLTLASLQDDGVLLAWCGDSRIMHIRSGKVVYETTDHSLVAQLVKQGQITEDEAAFHPQRNIILRSVNAEGHNSQLDFHILTDLRSGDWLLLCTDGVLENLDRPAIARIFGAEADEPSLSRAFKELCEGRTSDNYSMYALRLNVSSEDSPMQTPSERHATSKDKRGMARWLAPVMIGLLCGALGFYLGYKWQYKEHPQDVVEADTTQNSSARRPSLEPIPVPSSDDGAVLEATTELHVQKPDKDEALEEPHGEAAPSASEKKAGLSNTEDEVGVPSKKKASSEKVNQQTNAATPAVNVKAANRPAVATSQAQDSAKLKAVGKDPSPVTAPAVVPTPDPDTAKF